MTLTEWILFAGFIVGGIVVGRIAGGITNRLLSNPSRPEPIQDAAKPLSSLVMYGIIITGLMVSLGILQP